MISVVPFSVIELKTLLELTVYLQKQNFSISATIEHQIEKPEYVHLFTTILRIQ